MRRASAETRAVAAPREPARRPAARAWRSHALALALLACAAFAALRGLAIALENRVALRFVGGAVFVTEVLLIAAGALAVGWALAVEFAAARRGVERARPLAPLAALVVVLAGAWALFLLFAQPFQRIHADLALALAAGAFGALVLIEGRSVAPLPRGARIAALACASLALTAFLAEAGLRVVARARPSPLLATASDGPKKQLERFRCAPGEVRFGFPCNSRGYYDEEFARAGPSEVRVAAIGDSFLVGAVPHAFHLTTVCERELGVAVDSFGVAGAGPPEYLAMLVEDALPLDPDLVVIQVFVGNDLSYGNVETDRPHQRLRAWLERDRVLLAVLPRRLARVAGERRARGGATRAVAAPQGLEASSFPWVDDPRLEQPSLSEEVFAGLETRRALEVCRGVPSAFEDACRMLLAARDAAGAIPLCVVIVPDEFQVEDDLWQEVRARAATPLDRDAPQRLLAAFLAREGIPFLDLLPALREVAPLEDGRRHVYHLRDTHFNARGNRVAGEALARFLAPRIGDAAAGGPR